MISSANIIKRNKYYIILSVKKQHLKINIFDQKYFNFIGNQNEISKTNVLGILIFFLNN